MRIIGIVPVKNEADNWLDACLSWSHNFLDELVVYDDRSTDESVQVALKHTPHVVVRGTDEPSFMEHEGRFRQNAWNSMTAAVEPEDGDWILAFDADEFLVGGFTDPIRDRLTSLMSIVEDCGYEAANISKPEVWQHGAKLLVRTDGFWSGSTPRFATWKPDRKFRDRAMGCGSLPKEYESKVLKVVHMVSLLHFGYSTEQSRELHYQRYVSLKDHGHNPKHIKSILEQPRLVEYVGPAPKIWRGHHA